MKVELNNQPVKDFDRSIILFVERLPVVLENGEIDMELLAYDGPESNARLVCKAKLSEIYTKKCTSIRKSPKLEGWFRGYIKTRNNVAEFLMIKPVMTGRIISSTQIKAINEYAA